MSTQEISQSVTAALIVIADEVLSGRTRDQNIGNVASHLTRSGIHLREVRVIPDYRPIIVETVNDLRARMTYVFTTGGLGPTHDDLTAESIAAAFDVALAVDPRAVALMRPYYEARNLELTPARLRMARIPSGSELIPNPVSAAPGFITGNVIVLPGIPETARLMLQSLTGQLASGPAVSSVSIAVPRPESELAELLAQHQEEFPDVAMGSYPQMRDGAFTTEFVLRATDQRMLADAVDRLRTKLIARGHTPSS